MKKMLNKGAWFDVFENVTIFHFNCNCSFKGYLLKMILSNSNQKHQEILNSSNVFTFINKGKH